MASLWNRSGMVERYADDLRATGAMAFFFNGGTTTPLTVFQDSGQSSAHPNPVVADANGRWPDVFIPYIVSYDVQVKTADGVQLTYTLQVPNPDPVAVSVTIPPANQVQTGMIHAEMVNTTKAGFVRLNGRTIGNSSSVGTERANDDTSALFQYLWNNLTNAIAPVSGGRGAGAASDFAANKTITLPTWQGVGPVGLDDMGAVAGNFFTGLSFATGNTITPGSLTGANGLALAAANLPAHSHTGTTSTDSGHTHGVSGTTGNTGTDHTHTFNAGLAGGVTDAQGLHTHSLAGFVVGTSATGNQVAAGAQVSGAASNPSTSSDGGHTHNVSGSVSGTTSGMSLNHTHTFTTTSDLGGSHSHTFSTTSVGSSSPFNNLGRSILVTWFIKL